MTGPILTVLLLALLAVGLIVVGVYLIIGLGPSLIALGVFAMGAAVITARGVFRIE